MPISDYFDHFKGKGAYCQSIVYKNPTFEFLENEFKFMTETLGVSTKKALATIVYLATRVQGYSIPPPKLNEETLRFLDSKQFDYNSKLFLTSTYNTDHPDDLCARTEYLVAYACENDNLELMKKLKDRGADLHVICSYKFMYDKNGELSKHARSTFTTNGWLNEESSLLDIVIRSSCDHKMIKFLLENGVRIHSLDYVCLGFGDEVIDTMKEYCILELDEATYSYKIISHKCK